MPAGKLHLVLAIERELTVIVLRTSISPLATMSMRASLLPELTVNHMIPHIYLGSTNNVESEK